MQDNEPEPTAYVRGLLENCHSAVLRFDDQMPGVTVDGTPVRTYPVIEMTVHDVVLWWRRVTGDDGLMDTKVLASFLSTHPYAYVTRS